jgi:hypothetical protein
LASFQRVGGGTATVTGTMQSVLGDAGHKFKWSYDDTLIGKGQGGVDLLIMTVPEVEAPSQSSGGPNTAEFNGMQPGMNATIIQLMDMAAPREIVGPLPAGAVDITSELRFTSGWAIRPEATTLISMPSS